MQAGSQALTLSVLPAARAPPGAELDNYASAAPAADSDAAWLECWGWDLCGPDGLCERVYGHLGMPMNAWPALKALAEVCCSQHCRQKHVWGIRSVCRHKVLGTQSSGVANLPSASVYHRLIWQPVPRGRQSERLFVSGKGKAFAPLVSHADSTWPAAEGFRRLAVPAWMCSKHASCPWGAHRGQAWLTCPCSRRALCLWMTL